MFVGVVGEECFDAVEFGGDAVEVVVVGEFVWFHFWRVLLSV